MQREPATQVVPNPKWRVGAPPLFLMPALISESLNTWRASEPETRAGPQEVTPGAATSSPSEAPSPEGCLLRPSEVEFSCLSRDACCLSLANACITWNHGHCHSRNKEDTFNQRDSSSAPRLWDHWCYILGFCINCSQRGARQHNIIPAKTASSCPGQFASEFLHELEWTGL